MSTKRRLSRVLQNPLVVIPPLVIVLALGWQQYTYAGRDLSLPAGGANILPNGSFSEFKPDGVPDGWGIGQTGDLTYAVSRGGGYTGGTAFAITVGGYRNGDVVLTSPKMAVQAGQSYLFKGYYSTSTPFALLVHSFYRDGTDRLQLMQTYAATAGAWTTASTAFRADDSLTDIQIVYRLYANGQLQLDGLYLEPQDDIYVAPATGGDNAIPNAKLASHDYDMPQDWSTYRSGDNTASFSYQQTASGAGIQTRVSNYKNGQAKWQYTAQNARPDQYYRAGLDYQSNVPVPLVAEYVLQNGQRQTRVITTLPPADSWTSASYPFQTVPGTANLFISLPLEQNGTVASRNYSLTDITVAGPSHWQQPLVSLTFDDGWQQAYDNAAPLLARYDYTATFYVNPSTIETPHFMTAGELQALTAGGNEIAAHGYDHEDLTAINDRALDYQLRQGRDYLRGAGFQVDDVATPYDRSDAEVQYYARQYFATLRGNTSGINTRQNLDPYDLRVISITARTTPADITAALQNAKVYNGWVIFSYRQISDDPSATKSLHAEDAVVSPAAFQQQLEHIHDSGIKVLSVTTAYQSLEQSNSGGIAYEVPNF